MPMRQRREKSVKGEYASAVEIVLACRHDNSQTQKKSNKEIETMPQEKQKNNLRKLDKYFTRLQLPEKVGHVSVWTVDSPKS